MLNNAYLKFPDPVREWRNAKKCPELLKSSKLLFRRVGGVSSKDLLHDIDDLAAR